MDVATLIAAGALLVSVGQVVVDRALRRRTGAQGDRALDLQEDDLSLRQLQAANAALEHRADGLEARLGRAESKLEACEKREQQAKQAEEEREKRWKAKVDELMTLLIRNGITP